MRLQIIGITLIVASVLSNTASSQPLNPGHPAGIHEARMTSYGTAIMLGTGIAILVAVGVVAFHPSAELAPQQIKAQYLAAPATAS